MGEPPLQRFFSSGASWSSKLGILSSTLNDRCFTRDQQSRRADLMVISSPHNVPNIEESEIECSRLKHSRLLIQMVILQKEQWLNQDFWPGAFLEKFHGFPIPSSWKKRTSAYWRLFSFPMFSSASTLSGPKGLLYQISFSNPKYLKKGTSAERLYSFLIFSSASLAPGTLYLQYLSIPKKSVSNLHWKIGKWYWKDWKDRKMVLERFYFNTDY